MQRTAERPKSNGTRTSLEAYGILSAIATETINTCATHKTATYSVNVKGVVDCICHVT